MTNIISVILSIMYVNDPLMFYLFLAFIIIGIVLTYLYRLEVGLGVTAIISALFYYGDIFMPWIYMPLVGSIVLLVLSIIGVKEVTRYMKNFVNWFYLRRLSRKPASTKKT